MILLTYMSRCASVNMLKFFHPNRGNIMDQSRRRFIASSLFALVSAAALMNTSLAMAEPTQVDVKNIIQKARSRFRYLKDDMVFFRDQLYNGNPPLWPPRKDEINEFKDKIAWLKISIDTANRIASIAPSFKQALIDLYTEANKYLPLFSLKYGQVSAFPNDSISLPQ